jgi:hypothetical protein
VLFQIQILIRSEFKDFVDFDWAKLLDPDLDWANMLDPVLWIRNYFFSDPDPILLWLDLQKFPDPVPNPTLNIHSFTMPTILKVLSWHFKESFSRKCYFNTYIFIVIFITLLLIFMPFGKVQVQFRSRFRILQKVSDPCGYRLNHSGPTTLDSMRIAKYLLYANADSDDHQMRI